MVEFFFFRFATAASFLVVPWYRYIASRIEANGFSQIHVFFACHFVLYCFFLNLVDLRAIN